MPRSACPSTGSRSCPHLRGRGWQRDDLGMSTAPSRGPHGSGRPRVGQGPSDAHGRLGAHTPCTPGTFRAWNPVGCSRRERRPPWGRDSGRRGPSGGLGVGWRPGCRDRKRWGPAMSHVCVQIHPASTPHLGTAPHHPGFCEKRTLLFWAWSPPWGTLNSLFVLKNKPAKSCFPMQRERSQRALLWVARPRGPRLWPWVPLALGSSGLPAGIPEGSHSPTGVNWTPSLSRAD